MTAVLVVAISEVAKRSSLLGAVLASIPLTSVLAMIWLYADTGDAEKVADLATGIFWLVLPSLALVHRFAAAAACRLAVSRQACWPPARSPSPATSSCSAILKRFGIAI